MQWPKNKHTILKNIILTILLLISFQLTLVSQNLKKELQSQIWYWTGDINDTTPLTLIKTKPEKFDFIAEFKKNSRLILVTPTSAKVDSIFSYAITRKHLILNYETKDSSYLINYYSTFPADNNSIHLKRGFSMKATGLNDDTVTYDNLWLTKRWRQRDVYRHDNIIVYSRITDSSAIKERTRGDFYQVRGDSLFIDTKRVASEHFSMTGRDTMPPYLKVVRLHNISKLYHEREKLNLITGWGIGLSVISTLIVAPLISIQPGGMKKGGSGINYDRYIKVAGTSLASTALFITMRIGLSHKKMVFKNKRNSWKRS